jgi:hypothetical protein
MKFENDFVTMIDTIIVVTHMRSKEGTYEKKKKG